MLPLLAGLAELGFWTLHGHPASISGQIQAFVSSFALILVGLFIAGPWLTMAAARAMARWTSRPGTLIAARRIADDPKAAFRAVSGLVLALFITTVAVGGDHHAGRQGPHPVRHRGGIEHAERADRDRVAGQLGRDRRRAGRARRGARRAAGRDSRRPGNGRGPRWTRG